MLAEKWIGVRPLSDVDRTSGAFFVRIYGGTYVRMYLRIYVFLKTILNTEMHMGWERGLTNGFKCHRI